MAKVTINISVESAEGNYKVHIDRADLTNQGHGVVDLEWLIVNSTVGWRFPPDEDAIEIKGDTAGVFDSIETDGKWRRATKRRQNKHYDPSVPAGPAVPGMIYDYCVTLTNGPTTLTIDPIIINQP